MKAELQAQLDGLKALLPGIENEDHPQHMQYVRLEAAMREVNKVPQEQWNDPETHERIKEAANNASESNNN